MLVELARLFADLGFYDQADPPVFHIHGVTGPDEYTAVVDDNLYTNVMARFTLRFAADVVTRLRSEDPDAHRALAAATGLAVDEVAEWTRAAGSMCVLYDADLGINPQDDAFLGHEAWDWEGTPADKYPLLLNFHPLVIYRHQVLKQADVVLAMYLRGEEFAPDVQRRNFDYYDAVTLAIRHCRHVCRRSWPPRSGTPTWRCTNSGSRCSSTSPTRTATPSMAPHCQRWRVWSWAWCTGFAGGPRLRNPRPHRAGLPRAGRGCASACTGAAATSRSRSIPPAQPSP